MLRACRRCLTSTMPLKRQQGLDFLIIWLILMFTCRLNHIIVVSARELRQDIELMGYHIPANVTYKKNVQSIYNPFFDRQQCFIHTQLGKICAKIQSGSILIAGAEMMSTNHTHSVSYLLDLGQEAASV